jgi:hypothetical protein
MPQTVEGKSGIASEDLLLGHLRRFGLPGVLEPLAVLPTPVD